MKPQRIFLVRHGESSANVDLKVYETVPDYQVPLSPNGHLQARTAGERLAGILKGEKVAVYGSPYHRARQTRNGIISALGQDQVSFVREDPRIREQEYGHLRTREEGERIETQQEAYNAFYFRVPDGESGADCYDRASSFLDTMFRDFEKEDFPPNALLVSHGLFIRLFLMRWFHWTPEEFLRTLRPENCQITTLQRAACGHYKLTEPYALKPKAEWGVGAHDFDASHKPPTACLV